MAIDILYFAWVREMIGRGEERVDPPAEAATVRDLVAWLAQRGGGYAEALGDAAKLRAAIDQQFVSLETSLGAAREVAIFPPVTGGSIRVVVSEDAIDVAGELVALEGAGGGAVATFTGLVRADDGVGELMLEHYPGATEAALTKLAGEAKARWSLRAATIVHRIGAMTPGERIVFVGTCAPHRAAALDACAFLIDRLKTDAPFWKRETRGGEAAWVGERDSDRAAAEKWR